MRGRRRLRIRSTLRKATLDEVFMMGRSKTATLKARLGRKMKQNRRVPLFVVARTARRVSQNVRRRSWRSDKMDLKE